MSNDTIYKSAIFAASPETVWSFLTQKDKLALWFNPAENDLTKGKPYALLSEAEDGTSSKMCWGTVLEMDKPSRLVYTFTINPLAGELTTVTWTLEEIPGGTKLSLKHEGVGVAAGEGAIGLLMALDAGWDKHLAGLRSAISK
jgi:uncharacterized protein YndB with AHSA1/START domain